MLERQKVGIATAKERDDYKSRAPTAQAKTSKVLALQAKGLSKQSIANTCEIGVASVYRILKGAT